MKKLAKKTVHVNAVVPADLHARLVQQTAKETADRGHTVTPSNIIRWAIEDYLDQWETATFVPNPAQSKEG